MSALAVLRESSQTPLDPGGLDEMMGRLRHRGPDGSDVCLVGRTALGHWHFWTTPEEVHERQPLSMAGLPFRIVFDGRLDNRAELLAKLGFLPPEGQQLSDAALALRTYERWGEQCFEYWIGEFAVVILDEQRSELICARDALGDRTLFYAFFGTRLALASEAWAVASASPTAVRLNENAAAYSFALKAAPDGQTLFEHIYEFLPAQVMVVNDTGKRTWRYWQPDLSSRQSGQTNEEYAQQFRSLLEESVRCRLRSNIAAGVLMSGGLDSTSVACLAAPMLAPAALTTVSYIFDELADCDERIYINAVQARWGTNSIQIPSDDLWPFKNWADWPQTLNLPEGNLYRLVKERAYQRAQSEGLQILLTGGFGDHLYARAADWLADLLTEGRLWEAGSELALHLRYAGPRRVLEAGYIQSVLKKLPGARTLRRQSRLPAWLAPSAAERLKQDYTSPPNLVSLEAALSSSAEIFNASRYGLELRHPYRDRRLVEYVLTLPAHQLYYRGYYKPVLRRAMHDYLPDLIRNRRRPTSLVSLYLRGVKMEQATLQSSFLDAGAPWRKFVRADWLEKHLEALQSSEFQDGPAALVPWLCVSFDAWCRAHHFY